MSVSVGPGITLLIVMPRGPRSRAKALVRPATAALVITYSPPPPKGTDSLLMLYFAGQRLLPAKTRAFVDFVVEAFRKQRLAARFSAV